jgi:hypothetical protein
MLQITGTNFSIPIEISAANESVHHKEPHVFLNDCQFQNNLALSRLIDISMNGSPYNVKMSKVDVTDNLVKDTLVSLAYVGTKDGWMIDGGTKSLPLRTKTGDKAVVRTPTLARMTLEI